MSFDGVEDELVEDGSSFNMRVLAEEVSKSRVLEGIRANRARSDSALSLSSLGDIPSLMDTHSLENYGADGVPIVPLDVRERLFEEIPEPIDTPHFHTFQRVVITDADRSMDWDSDKIEACKRIKKCLGLREKWMGLHPSPPQDVVDESLSEPAASPPNSPTRRTTFDLAGVKVTYRRRRELEYEFFDSAIPSKTDEYSYKMVDGVVHVFETERNGEERVFEVPDFSEYVKDYEYNTNTVLIQY